MLDVLGSSTTFFTFLLPLLGHPVTDDMSISDILQQTLDLIGNEAEGGSTKTVPPNTPNFTTNFLIQAPNTANNSGPAEGKTASSILLEERRKLKRKMEEIDEADFTEVSSSGKSKKNRGDPTGSDLYLSQISDSQVDAPKYWTAKKSVTLNGNNNAAVVNTSRKTAEKQSRGADYQDRLSMKHSKLKLKNKLKRK